MSKRKPPYSIRQGDVLLVQVDAIPANATEIQPTGDIVLAHGEVTGHAHRIHAVERDPSFTYADDTQDSRIRYWDAAAERFVQGARANGLTAVALRHEEHAPINLDRPIFKQGFQVEDFGEYIRPVAD